MEPCGVLLRRHRVATVLTQERLAERARISATGIAALEAGRRKLPRSSTAVRALVAPHDSADAHAGELVRLVPELAAEQGWLVGSSHARPGAGLSHSWPADPTGRGTSERSAASKHT